MRIQLTNAQHFFSESKLNSKVILKSIIDADDNFHGDPQALNQSTHSCPEHIIV